MKAARILAFVAGALLCACNPASNICGDQTEPMTQPDAGAFRCVQAEDCPRPSNVFVCVTTGSLEDECVACEDTTCVRHIPEPCK